MKVRINGRVEDIGEELTLAALLTARDANRKGVAVALDGEVVPRRCWDTTMLRQHATVEVLTAVQGG
ncbi:MAG: sulfur carrier protein ThiS [Sciscionella sp.]